MLLEPKAEGPRLRAPRLLATTCCYSERPALGHLGLRVWATPRLVCQLAVDAVSKTHVFHAISRDALEIADGPPMSYVRAVAGLSSTAERCSEVDKGHALLVTPIGPHLHRVHNIARIVLAK